MVLRNLDVTPLFEGLVLRAFWWRTLKDAPREIGVGGWRRVVDDQQQPTLGSSVRMTLRSLRKDDSHERSESDRNSSDELPSELLYDSP
jgi:hypothetical protein